MHSTPMSPGRVPTSRSTDRVRSTNTAPSMSANSSPATIRRAKSSPRLVDRRGGDALRRSAIEPVRVLEPGTQRRSGATADGPGHALGEGGLEPAVTIVEAEHEGDAEFGLGGSRHLRLRPTAQLALLEQQHDQVGGQAEEPSACLQVGGGLCGETDAHPRQSSPATSKPPTKRPPNSHRPTRDPRSPRLPRRRRHGRNLWRAVTSALATALLCSPPAVALRRVCTPVRSCTDRTPAPQPASILGG